MMNRCAYQQQNHHRSNNNGGDLVMNGVVCPKPRRRLCLLNPSINDAVVSNSSPRSQQHRPTFESEMCESKARTELLDMILTKGSYGAEKTTNPLPSSPPFFCGSPPSRAPNPVVHDAQFANEKPSVLSPSFESSPSSARKNGGGCTRVKFGQKHPKVRVEGFKCRGISAVA